MELNKTLALIFFFINLNFSIGSAQEKTIRFKKLKSHNIERPVKINPEVLKSLNLRAPLRPSASTHVSAYGVDELTDELLGRKKLKVDSSTDLRPLLGTSVFQGFYQSRVSGQWATVDSRWLVPKDFLMQMHPNRITLDKSILASIHKKYWNGGQRAPILTFSMEKILENIFRGHAKDCWTAYSRDFFPRSLWNKLSVDMPDSLVRLRMLASSDVDSVIQKSDKKYKIVYFFCADKNMKDNNFDKVSSYVASHKELFHFVPISGMKELSSIALYLKHQGFFDQAYVVDRPGGVIRALCKMADLKKVSSEPSLFVLDGQNHIIATETDSALNMGGLQSLSDLP
jgi:hypothetical protein